MEGVIKAISEIKEEYACTSNDIQKVAIDTSKRREKIRIIEEEIHQIEGLTKNEEQAQIMAQIDCEDEAMKVRMAQDELEVLVADRDSAKHTLQIEAAKWLDLSRKAQDQKSPDDYKRELLEKSRGLDALKKEIEEEKSRNVMLRSRLKASQQAETRLKELKATIGTLKGLRASYNTEIAAQEASMRRKKTPHESFEELQSQLQEAQQRYQFLCASIDLLP